MDLERSYARCARITRREARNFYVAFLSLPRGQRRSIYALYAFCREADDLVDEWDGAPRDTPLPSLRQRLARAADPAQAQPQDLALSDTLQRFGVCLQDLEDVLTGIEMDLTLSRMPDERTLDTYAYHVASAVGLATLPILTGGVPPSRSMRDAAVQLGKGMQYVNILRDVAEDVARDRVYVPADLLARHGVDEVDLHARAASPRLRAALAHLGERAQALLTDGRALIPMLPQKARACPWLLAEIYGRLLRQIQRNDHDVLSARATLPRWEKLWLLISTAGRPL